MEQAVVGAVTKRMRVRIDAGGAPPTAAITFVPPCDGAVLLQLASILERDFQCEKKKGNRCGLFGKTGVITQDFWCDLLAGADLPPSKVGAMMDGRFYRLIAPLVRSLEFGIPLPTLPGVHSATFTAPICRLLRAVPETIQASFVLPTVVAHGAPPAPPPPPEC